MATKRAGGGGLDPMSWLGLPSLTGGTAGPSSAGTSASINPSTGAFVIGDGNSFDGGKTLIWIAAVLAVGAVLYGALRK